MLRVLRFSGGGAHQFDAHEREDGNLEPGHEAHEFLGGEEAAVAPEVGEARGACVGLEAGEDHHQAHHDQRHNGHDLYEGEPEFGLTEGLHGGQVQEQQDDDGGDTRDPELDSRPQFVGVARNRNDVCHAGDYPAEPVGPPGEEACPGAQEIACEVAEGLVVQVGQQQLAHGPHDEEQHESDDHVHKDHGGAGDGDGFSGAHEEAGSDGAADGKELNVAVAERA